MLSHAAAEQTPAMLAEISRRRAERGLQQAASRSVSIDLLGQVMAQATTNAIAEMEREITALAGGRYERSDGRRGERNGTAAGYVVVGGRKVKVARPRLVDSVGKEVPLESYAAMQDPATLDATAMRKVIVGVAQRRVNDDVAEDQPLPEGQEAYGLSRSSVSRRLMAAGSSGAPAMLSMRWITWSCSWWSSRCARRALGRASRAGTPGPPRPRWWCPPPAAAKPFLIQHGSPYAPSWRPLLASGRRRHPGVCWRGRRTPARLEPARRHVFAPARGGQPFPGSLPETLAAQGLRETGGRGGIRTLGTLRYTRSPGVPVQPLLHPSRGRDARIELGIVPPRW